MFPDAEFLTLDLYHWMHVIGIIAAMIVARLMYKRVGVSDKLFNFGLITALPGIVLGYVFAALFQSWYTYLETGVFRWGAGSTFYGGLIGAVAVYLAVYFGVGHFLFKNKEHIAKFNRVLSVAIPCVVLAHGIGRIGCLFAGCCYGAVTDSPIGIEMFTNGIWERRIPIQLFEAIFLFLLFGVLVYLAVAKKCDDSASIYLIAYGVWRFCIEYARDDDRGASGISFLTPSQLTSIILVLAGIALLLLNRLILKKLFEKAGAHEEV